MSKRRYRDLGNARKIYSEKKKVDSAFKERGGRNIQNKNLRKILREYYQITNDLQDYMLDDQSKQEITEEDVKRLTSRLKQMEAFIRATKNVK